MCCWQLSWNLGTWQSWPRLLLAVLGFLLQPLHTDKKSQRSFIWPTSSVIYCSLDASSKVSAVESQETAFIQVDVHRNSRSHWGESWNFSTWWLLVVAVLCSETFSVSSLNFEEQVVNWEKSLWVWPWKYEQVKGKQRDRISWSSDNSFFFILIKVFFTTSVLKWYVHS